MNYNTRSHNCYNNNQRNNNCYDNNQRNNNCYNDNPCDCCCGSSIVCPPGPIGPKGPTGAIGPVGPIGPTGPVANNFAYIINSNLFEATLPNQPIPLDTNLVIIGTDISHVANSTDIHLAADHCYLVNWTAIESTSIDVSPLTLFSVQLLLNGDPVPGSAVQELLDTTFQITTATLRGRSCIVCTTIPSILQVSSPSASQLQPSTFPETTINNPNVSITIVQIS